MKFTIALPLALATLGLAAPAVEKRATGQVTLYTATNYGGSSTTITIDTGDSGTCMNLPSSFNNRVLSVRLSEEGGSFHCRLFDANNCAVGNDDTWFFNYNIPDLGAGDYVLGNRASSIFCAHS